MRYGWFLFHCMFADSSMEISELSKVFSIKLTSLEEFIKILLKELLLRGRRLEVLSARSREPRKIGKTVVFLKNKKVENETPLSLSLVVSL